ncbi:Pentapeptide repeats (8 copies) [Musa troglodytarum]|uniref:Pentapeptide repeats (8 copies) n=1 Tax=Musa troglodytarum TaxID=320322 RepID=A0A9E7G635_9LILI|nr:Pentapeptide repeats (8 copies) [Musa troglodytarum]
MAEIPLGLGSLHQTLATAMLVAELGEGLGRVSAVALVAASLFFADPALAFKGGGPYGAEVTRGQDLTGKDFSGKTLIKQDFKTSILRQANFKGAKLLGASFFDADLTGADLSDADLRGADFSLANVTKANLSNANLEGALATGNTSFRGSNIDGAGNSNVKLSLYRSSSCLETSQMFPCEKTNGSTFAKLPMDPMKPSNSPIRWAAIDVAYHFSMEVVHEHLWIDLVACDLDFSG